MRLTPIHAVALLAVMGVVAPVTAAGKPELLKRHGIVYGVRSIDDSSCAGYEVLDMCETYTLSGTIISVDRNPDTHRVDDFVVRTADGGTKMQNFEDYMPSAADALIRCGRRVRVSGVMTGMGRVAFPSRIVVVGGAGRMC